MVAKRGWDDRSAAVLVAGLVGYALEVKPARVLDVSRGTIDVVRARQVAMYLVYVGFGMSIARVADAFDRDRSTVSHACRVVEDRREDPAFDAWIERFTSSLEAFAPLREVA